MQQTLSEAAPPRASFVEDFIDIFYAPASVFERRRDASPWPALLVVTGLFALLSYASFKLLGPAIDADVARNMAAAMAANPQITPEAAEKMRGFSRIMMMVGSVVGVPIAVLVLGLVLWFVGKLFDATEPLRAAFFIIIMSWLPRLVETLLGAVQGLFLDPAAMTSVAAVSLTPARFVDAASASPVMLVLLQRFGPFVIWSYVIVAIGLAVLGRIPRGKAALASVILWALATLPALLGALRQPS
jgi:hypothetical protein